MLNNPAEYERMATVEKDHWWYRILHERVIKALKSTPSPLRGTPPTLGGEIKVLDAGCGTGGLMLKLFALGYQVKGADLSADAIVICSRRGLDVIQSDVRHLPEKLAGQQFDAIICNDVLCYFEEEEIQTVLNGLKALLKTGGLLIMNNPVYYAFSGSHDVAVGIVTRFEPKKLERAINYNLSVISSIQWPFLLSPLVYLVRKLTTKEQSDIDMPPRWLNSLLYGICKLEMKLFRKAPWGSSMFIVARKM